MSLLDNIRRWHRAHWARKLAIATCFGAAVGYGGSKSPLPDVPSKPSDTPPSSVHYPVAIERLRKLAAQTNTIIRQKGIYVDQPR